MRRLLAGMALLCLLVAPAFAHDKDKPKDPPPPEVRAAPREPDRGEAWWAMDGPRRMSGPYYALRECQRAILRTRWRCELVRD